MSTDSASKFDYGFDRPETIETGVYEEFMQSYLKVVDRRGRRWKPVMKSGTPHKGFKVKRFIRKGIPPEHRARIWMVMSGAEDRMKEGKDVYRSLLKKTPESVSVEVITADVPRTFPENIFFRNSEDPRSKMKMLSNILTAFSIHNPEIGYCQGLNYVGAVLLLIAGDEEKSFWLLDTLVTEILPGYYHPSMEDVQVDCMVLEALIKEKIPQVSDLLEQAGTTCALLCTKWFICIFADVLPFETVLRVLDCLFYEGDKILFRAALTLIKMHEDRLLACRNFPQVVTTFKEIVHDRSALFCHDFCLKMFKLPGSLSRRKLQHLRRESKEKVVAKQPRMSIDDDSNDES